MKKKIASLMMVLLMCVSALAGCSLVTLNAESYYEATVATIEYSDGTTETITKRQLLSSYNSYGYYYVEYYGYETKEAIELTLESLIETRLTIKEVKDYYAEKGEKLLTDAETTYLWDETYDTVYDNLKDYFLDNQGISYGDDEDEEDASSNIFVDYERSAVLVENSDGSLSIQKLSTSTTTRDTYTARYVDGEAYDCENETFLEIMYNKLTANMSGTDSSARAWKSAFADYISDVKDSYSYTDFESDKDCFLFEINRVYEILRDNYLVEKYTEIYNKAEYGDGSLAGVTVSDILSYYSAKVRSSYADYVTYGDTGSFEDDVLNDIANTYYVVEGNTNYFYLAYIKIEFTDEQSTRLEELQDGDSYISYDDAQAEIEALYNSLKATVRDSVTGEETSKTVDAEILLQQIKTKLAGVKSASEAVAAAESFAASSGEELSSSEIASIARNANYNKADAFRDYLYLYNDDDTLKNADYNDVFGVSNSGEVLLNDNFSSLADEELENVEEAIKSLYNNGNAEVGDTSDLVRTNDGYYIFFYAGDVENIFLDVDENFDASKDANNIKILASTRLNVFSSKTIFDSLYDELASSNFSTFQNMDMNRLYSKTVEILTYDAQLKDLY